MQNKIRHLLGVSIEDINIYLYPFIIAFMSIYYDIIQEFRQKGVQAEEYFLFSRSEEHTSELQSR